ncbi:uncharacterized protein LOC142320566 isoform X2 [Lycorma delicatula]|uniref:uncharacterized protein LOC142320566 isoform X2 n=1 Tax=Lycorma delicatula TaxID=130591 RepID=UPI003F5124A5
MSLLQLICIVPGKPTDVELLQQKKILHEFWYVHLQMVNAVFNMTAFACQGRSMSVLETRVSNQNHPVQRMYFLSQHPILF